MGLHFKFTDASIVVLGFPDNHDKSRIEGSNIRSQKYVPKYENHTLIDTEDGDNLSVVF